MYRSEYGATAEADYGTLLRGPLVSTGTKSDGQAVALDDPVVLAEGSPHEIT